jgi:ComF family protein
MGPACPRCALPTPSSQLCGHCLTTPPEQQLSFSAYPYQDPIDRLIIDFKFNNKLYLSDFFAEQMICKLNPNKLPELLIPIPLHPNRLKHRGYNQSFELAKSLSKQLTIPSSNGYLERIIDTQSQSSMPFKQRKQNIQHAFKGTLSRPPKHIALIDDVLTTGHTANAAAKILRQAGATMIEVWTIARTIRHD